MADMTSGYSLSDLKAVMNDDGGGFGSGNGWWIILLFLFFLGFGGNGLFGGKGGGVIEQGATQSSVDQLANRVDFNSLNSALSGNKDAINSLANSLGVSTSSIIQAVNGVNSTVQQTAAATGLNICELGAKVQAGDASIVSTLQNCCCSIKTEMLGQANLINMSILNGFNATDRSLCAMQNNLSTQITAGNQRIIDAINAQTTTSLQNKVAELSQTAQTAQIIAAIQNNNNGCCASSCCSGSCC